MVCVPLGDSAVLVRFGSAITEGVAEDIRRAASALAAHLLPGVRDVVPSFTTIGVHFDPVEVGSADPYARVVDWIQGTMVRQDRENIVTAREWTIAVRYGGECGPDLEDIGRRAGLSVEGVIARHSEAVYSVGAVGFSPGFPYLLGLPPVLVTPRRSTPRTAVVAGSVAIGGVFTGIYPSATPGGWNLIGRTSEPLFSPRADPPAKLRVGDRVRFQPVN